MKRKRLSYLLPLIVATFIFSLFSCKPDNDKGNIVTVRIPTEPDKLNPFITEDAPSMIIMSQIFMPLLEFHPKTLELTPVLAKSRPTIAQIDTGKFKGSIAYAYEIRDEAMWDNGKPVTGNDYLFTVKTIFNKKIGSSNLKSGLDFIKDIVLDAQNPKKFTVYSNKAYILSETNSSTFQILPEYIYDNEGVLKKYSVADLVKTAKDTTQKQDENLMKFAGSFQNIKHSREKGGIVGCGPYAFDEWISGQSISLKKKANWWGEKLASLSPFMAAFPDKIVYKPIKEASAVMSLIQNGELDAAYGIPAKDFTTMQKEEKLVSQYELATFPTLTLAHIGFNCKEPKLTDKRTRKAIAHIFDIDAIVKNIAGGLGTPSVSPFLPIRPYYNTELQAIPLNTDKAKTLLAEAGWKDSNGDGIVDKKIGGKTTELVLRFVFASGGTTKDLGLMLQESGKKAGIGIKLEPVEAAIMSDYLKKRNYDIFYNGSSFAPNIDDPKEIWHSTSNTPDGANRYQFENKQADALIDQIRVELNEQKRNVLYKQFQALIYEEQPAVFILVRHERMALNKRFETPVMVRRPGFLPNTFKLKNKE